MVDQGVVMIGARCQYDGVASIAARLLDDLRSSYKQLASECIHGRVARLDGLVYQ